MAGQGRLQGRRGGTLLGCSLIALLVTVAAWLFSAHGGEAESFVRGPVELGAESRSPSLGAAASQEDSEAALRERVAQLERKLAEKLLDPPEEEQELPPSILQPLIDQAVQEVPELQQVEDARMGMTEDKMYVFEMGNKSGKQAIYRRKYEVLGMVLTQQEAYTKAARRAVKRAKDSPAVEELMKLKKEGGLGLTKKQMQAEMGRMEAVDNFAAIIFRDIIPKLEENPLADTIGYLSATFFLLLVLIAFGFCLVPPVVPDE
ncbi:unnamed protein product [Symbiodinium natans]|uniref:Transmembrane protein n=1 Tax=Symbiodinium natans TaxID=878477 RepID=A0A812SSF5_9DINO|nr:unnamed protein product [Symbiodinium natans]